MREHCAYLEGDPDGLVLDRPDPFQKISKPVSGGATLLTIPALYANLEPFSINPSYWKTMHRNYPPTP
jgi:hypothetical protein